MTVFACAQCQCQMSRSPIRRKLPKLTCWQYKEQMAGPKKGGKTRKLNKPWNFQRQQVAEEKCHLSQRLDKMKELVHPGCAPEVGAQSLAIDLMQSRGNAEKIIPEWKG